MKEKENATVIEQLSDKLTVQKGSTIIEFNNEGIFINLELDKYRFLN